MDNIFHEVAPMLDTSSICEGDTIYGIVVRMHDMPIVMITACDDECTSDELCDGDSVDLPEPYGIILFSTNNKSTMNMILLPSHADADTLPPDVLVPEFSSLARKSKWIALFPVLQRCSEE